MAFGGEYQADKEGEILFWKGSKDPRNTGFAAALWYARRALTARVGQLIPVRLIANALGVSEDEYTTYENGRVRVSREVLGSLCIFFALHAEIVGDLKASYDLAYGKQEAVVPFDFLVDERSPNRTDESIEATKLHMEAVYNGGDVKGSIRIAESAWPHIARYGVTSLSSVGFAMIFSRIASQRGAHESASRILAAVKDRTQKIGSPVLQAQHLMLAIQHTNRMQARSGLASARAYEETFDFIRAMSGQEDPFREPTWKRVWNHTYRSMIVALTTVMGDDEVEYLHTLRERYLQSVGEVEDDPEYRLANDLIISRMTAAIGSPDHALEGVEQINRRDLEFTAQSLTAHSRVVALYRSEDVEQSLGEIDAWIERFRATDMATKRRQFEFLRSQIIAKRHPKDFTP